MLILVLIYTQILFSSNDEEEKEIPSRLLENSVEKITDTNIENEKIETSGPKQLTDLVFFYVLQCFLKSQSQSIFQRIYCTFFWKRECRFSKMEPNAFCLYLF